MQYENAVGRRAFVRNLALGAGAAITAGHAAPAAAAEPVTRTGTPYMKLSLAAYSFNRLLPRRGDAGAQAKAKMRLDDFVQFCADQDLDACEPTSYYFPKEVTHDYLMALKEKTFRLGLDISGTAIGNDFCVAPGPERDRQLADTREWIEHAATMGAPVIRIFAGKLKDGMSEAEALDLCVAGIDESLAYAATRGVFLALENHGGITATADQLLAIVERVKPSPWFGVNLDSGNFHSEDPYAELARIAPYSVNAQIKVMVKRDGQEKEPADFARIIDILREADYRGYVVLEYEESADPFKAIPEHLDRLRGLIRG